MQEIWDAWWMPLSIAIVGLPLIIWGLYEKWKNHQFEKYEEWKKQQEQEGVTA